MTNDTHSLSTSLSRAAKLFAKGDLTSALAQYLLLTKGYKKSADAWFGLACVLHAKCNLKEAEDAYRKVIRLGGSTQVSAWFNLGNLLRDDSRLNEAVSAYQAAIAINTEHAGAKFSLSQLALLQGDWLSGWDGYEFRRSLNGYPVADNKRFQKLMARGPEWDGGVISGRRRLLIYSEQGAGDTIQFLRFVLRLKDHVQVTLALPPVLLPLVQASPEFSELKCVSIAANLPAFDSHISLMSLPHRLGLSNEASLACTSYLKAPLDAEARWQAVLADASGLKVGLVWAGNPQHGNDSNRSMPFDQLSDLLAISGVTWISLQKELRAEEAESLLKYPVLRRYGERLADYDDTAGLIANLDLIISVDTSIVHLAGALGKPVWVMLPKVPDWRWLLARESSPWYPTARLFRQLEMRSWNEVLTQVQQALLSFKASLPITKYPEINFNEVDAALEASQFDLATKLCDAIELTIAEQSASAQGMLAFKRGCIALFLKQWPAAETYYRKAIITLPQLPEIHSNLALALGYLGRDAEAIISYQKALNLRPDFIDAWRNLARLHVRYQRDADALACFHHLLSLRSNDVVALKEIADCEQRMGRDGEAEAHYLRALALRPTYAEAGLNYGRLLRNTDRLDAAESIWKELLDRNPAYSLARMNLAMLDMVRGRWEQGWVNYEARWLVDSMPEFNRRRREELLLRAPEWRGQPLQGKTLLVYPEQGAGDTFQFLRFLPALHKRGAYVLLAATPNSQSLIEASGLCGANRLTTDSSDYIDFHVSLLSLPYRLGLGESGLSMDNPYLQAPQASAFRWREKLADASGFKVGICWSGNPQHANDHNRSIELSVLESLFALPGITWVSLQRTLRTGEAEVLAKLPQIRRYGELLDDFGDTAGLIANLDLVISVDTSVVHLAGALGKPVWVFLSKIQDWRWLLERKDSPWYPTARLFRQRITGHWSEAVNQVRQALTSELVVAAKPITQNMHLNALHNIVVISATKLSKSSFWEKSALGLSLQRYIDQGVSFSVKIAYENTRGLPEVFNDYINQAEDSATLVLVHDDVWMGDTDFTHLVTSGLERFDVIGVAGNRRRVPLQPNWIFSRLQGGRLHKDDKSNLSGCIAHGETAPGTESYYGDMPAECELLDGVFLAIKKSSLMQNNLRFDPQFDFHFYDMDFCRSARKAGLKLGTWPIKLTHQSKGGFDSPEWRNKYLGYLNKWEVEPLPTTLGENERTLAERALSQRLYASLRDGRYQEMEQLARQRLESSPDDVDTLKLLGVALDKQKRSEDALKPLLKAETLAPENVELTEILAYTLESAKQIDASILRFERLVASKPDNWRYAYKLALLNTQQYKLLPAIAAFEKVNRLNPTYLHALAERARLLGMLGRYKESSLVEQQAIKLDPNNYGFLSNAGATLTKIGDYIAAEDCLRRAIAVKKDFAAYLNLGYLLKKVRRLEDSLEATRMAIAIAPQKAIGWHNLCFDLNYADGDRDDERIAAARSYSDAICTQVRPYTKWEVDSNPSRRLRIGLVSGDFKNHPVTYFLLAVLTALDRSVVEVFAYSNSRAEDAQTAMIRAKVDHWQGGVIGLDDEKLARRIYQDRIDILIDLAGHTATTRLDMFARRPAPVQVAWLGYFATTGLSTIDWIIADPQVLPPKEESHFVEKPWRLPEIYYCFTPPDFDLKVGPLPAIGNGYITFGCFNNLTKVTDRVLSVWLRILQAVPKSHLMLKNAQVQESGVRNHLLEYFLNGGVASDRIQLEGVSPRRDYLDAYNKVDIALDPFPYPGGTTSVEGLWMGVPVLTLRGERFISHQGETIMVNAGLPEWIAVDEDDYVVRAEQFAADIPALATLRGALRSQVLSSPIYDATRFARNIEDAWRGMWQIWCESTQGIEHIVQKEPSLADRMELANLCGERRYTEMAVLTRAMLKQYPNSGELWRALGVAQGATGEDPRSAFIRATELSPTDIEAWRNLISAYRLAMDWANAVYALERLLQLSPTDVDVWMSLARARQHLGDASGAEQAWQKVLQYDPINVDAARALVPLLLIGRRKRIAQSGPICDVLLDHSPQEVDWLYAAHIKRYCCLWAEAEVAEHRVLSALREGRFTGGCPVPFQLLAVPAATAADQLRCAEGFAAHWISNQEPMYKHVHGTPSKVGKVRLAYLSNDFHGHATARLLTEVIELHDRSKFEIFAYDHSPHSEDPLRKRLLNAFDFVVDVRGLDDMQLANKISDDCIDVLIDLKGWTSGSRSSALALRLAPVQIQWLGYPGTMGAPWIDYIIADSVLIRDGDEKHYSEKIIFMPDAYQPNDRRRSLIAPPSREQLGLPDKALVLACFNQAYKITQNVLLVWINVLHKVPNAVLWLLEDNETATAQIRRELSLHGIEAHRLIMAPRMHADQHLARIQQADLALDCSPCGSHTTASDMLWAGVPLVALSGNTFASRVSESLLRAVGLPELVASSLLSYEMLILTLANQPAQLLAYRQRLSRQRLTAPLFDSQRFVRHLESGLLSAWQHYEAGRQPNHIYVKPQPIGNTQQEKALKVAVVTPYWRIPPEKLMRCIETVRQQTIPVTHFLVADGEPVSLPDDPNIVHVILPDNVGNKGAAPRGIGAQLAFNQGFDVVAFLDADNWFDADHMAMAVTTLEQSQLDVVFARRRIIFPDGEMLSVPLEEDESGSHVDTNCYVISRRASFLAGIWAMFPKIFGSGEDRLPLQVIRHLCLRSAYISHPTVWYESNWGMHYKLAGKKHTHALRVNSRQVGYHFDPSVYFQHTGILLQIDRAKDAEPILQKAPSKWKIAVITPYLGEPQSALLACIQSVSQQGLALTHYVLSSERYRCKIEDIAVRNWVLPDQYDDSGNTLRGVGAILAYQLGYDAVLFLNVDSVLPKNYIQHALSELETHSADVVISVLSNSVLIARSAAYLGMLWAQLPVSSKDDGSSLFYHLVQSSGAGVVNLEVTLNADKCAVDEKLDLAVQATSFSMAEVFQRTGRFLVN